MVVLYPGSLKGGTEGTSYLALGDPVTDTRVITPSTVLKQPVTYFFLEITFFRAKYQPSFCCIPRQNFCRRPWLYPTLSGDGGAEELCGDPTVGSR